MYSLMALLSLIAAAAFLHAFVFRRRAYIPVFALALAASLYTHNWGLFLGLMFAVAFLLCLRESPRSERRALRRDGLLAFGAVAVLYAPWVPTLLFQAGHTGAPWDLKPVLWALSQGLYSLVGGRGAAVALLLAGGMGLLALRQHAGRPRPRVLLAAECLLVLGVGTLLLAWVYSKTSPAWAIRYLAVIVGPMILLFGLGLARAGRMAVVAMALVVCFWVLDPVPSALVSKSNVAAAAARVRPHLGRDALVLSTQPEQVPTLAYYLPGVRHFATPLGPVRDPRVVDWINALTRLERSSVRGVLMPMIDRLPAGARVLLVVPTNLAKAPLWMRLINHDSLAWRSALKHDHQLQLLKATTGTTHGSGVEVEAYLFAKRPF